MLKKLQKIYSIRKIFFSIALSLLFVTNINAEEREGELNNLFKQLKNSQATQAIEVENKIWKIWVTHPTNDRKGFRLTELLDQGSLLIDRRQLKKAYEIFSQIIVADPEWSEAWNKRATTLYLMKQYQSSLDDINITLTLEPRHFGALTGQGLNYIELKQYEKAIESYKAAQKIYPVIDAAKKMIPQLQELINDQTI
jgi:tetratricopeptide (TPR) repeat protein